jgi:hypothetical protein
LAPLGLRVTAGELDEPADGEIRDEDIIPVRSDTPDGAPRGGVVLLDGCAALILTVLL